MRSRPKSDVAPSGARNGDEPRVVNLHDRSKAKSNPDQPKSGTLSSRRIRRINLDLPERPAQHLDWLQEETGAISTAEVIRNALKLYYGLACEVKDGGTILLKDGGGGEKEIKIFL